MNDAIEEGLRNRQATLDTLGNLAAIQQRNQLLAQQQQARA